MVVVVFSSISSIFAVLFYDLLLCEILSYSIFWFEIWFSSTFYSSCRLPADGASHFQWHNLLRAVWIDQFKQTKHFVFIGPFLKNWRPCWLSFCSNNFTFKSSVRVEPTGMKKNNKYISPRVSTTLMSVHTTMGDMFRGLCIRGGHPVPEGSAYID